MRWISTQHIVDKMKYDHGEQQDQSPGTSFIYLIYADRAYFPFCSAENYK